MTIFLAALKFIGTFYIIPIFCTRFGFLVYNYINNESYTIDDDNFPVIFIPILNIIASVAFIFMGIYWFGVYQPILLISPWFTDPNSFWESIFKEKSSNK